MAGVLGGLLADNYVTFGVLLSSYLLIPAYLGLCRGAPAWAKGAGAAAAAALAAVFASLVLGVRQPELYFFAIFLLFAAAQVAALPYRRREPRLYTALQMALIATLAALILLFQKMALLGAA